MSTGNAAVTIEARDDAQAQFQAVLRHFSLLLIWLDRGRPRKLCINGDEYHRRSRARRRRGRGR